MIDAIRCCKLALLHGIGGVLEIPSACFCKHPPIQYTDDEAHKELDLFLKRFEADANNTKRGKKMNEFKPPNLQNDIMLLLKGYLHDLNNLFTCILGNLGIAGNLSDNEEQNGRIRNAQLATLNATELTNLLMTACIGYDMFKEPYTIQKIIDDTIKICQPNLKVRITSRIPAQPCYISANASAIISALLNIILNANQAIDSSGTILLECFESIDCHPNKDNDSAKVVTIKISDNGNGFAERVFADAMKASFYLPSDNHGIGLQMASTMIEKNGGSITVQTEPDNGTMVTIKLPTIEFQEKQSISTIHG